MSAMLSNVENVAELANMTNMSKLERQAAVITFNPGLACSGSN